MVYCRVDCNLGSATVRQTRCIEEEPRPYANRKHACILNSSATALTGGKDGYHRGLSNYEYHFEVYLRYLKLLEWEHGTIILGTIESPDSSFLAPVLCMRLPSIELGTRGQKSQAPNNLAVPSLLCVVLVGPRRAFILSS